MKLYVTGWYTVDNSTDWQRGDRLTPDLTVFEPDPGPRVTGLVDAGGNPILCILRPEPLGFVVLRERK